MASSSSFKYHVFLSFRGEDTRYTFTDHLYEALRAKGIETFMDGELIRGELITPALVTAIEGSRHSIIVLSENYASSKWCLDELVKILHTQNTKGRRAVPIFYNVDPSDVGNQRGSFGKALAYHEKKLKYDTERVQEWRKALTRVGKIAGFTSSPDKPETQFIEEIVTNVSKDLNYVSSNDSKNLVGMDFHIRELELLLCLESTKVHMVGIWGMGGIGKTTLAKVIYEQLSCQFEHCCFLEGSTSMNDLKKELISQVLGDKYINMGLTPIKSRLHSKKVLIVIDNVNHQSMLETLVGERDWFGPQSRIIITTRDKHLLTVQGVEKNAIYEVKKLECDNAIQLFSHYAFKNKTPTRYVMELSQNIISYAQGLPLALKVLGCSLCGRDEDYWKDTLNRLEKIPNEEIQEVLQISFDGLKDDEKKIFLDIACFFKGSDKILVTKILESCGFFAISGIQNLFDKSLITVTNDGKLEMHDLIQEMGRQSVRKASLEEPGNRSRLWDQEDISHILKWETGAKEVEGIFLNLSSLEEEVNFTTKAFSRMTNLRLLKIYRSNLWDTGRNLQCKLHISNDFKLHYHVLRYLYWDQYPRESLPSDFESKNLASFCMPHSHLTQLWVGQKVFGKLEFVDVRYSQYLQKTPDFSRATNLQVLVLKGCTNLRDIHPSLGYLSKLILLNLKNCINLVHLPSIRLLESLKTLILSGCSKLKKLPEVPQDMPNLSKLYLDGTAITDFSGWSEFGNFQENSGNLDCSGELNSDDSTIRQLPSSSVVLRNHNASLSCVPRSSYFTSPHCTLTSLTHLNLSGTPIIHLSWNLERLSMLQKLKLKNCIRLQELPVLPSRIQHMNLSGTPIIHLPENFERLSRLKKLKLKNCRSLQELPVLPSRIRDMNLSGTPIIHLPENLKRLSRLQKLELENCRRLQELPVLPLRIQQMNLSGTPITHLPGNLERLSRLRYLALTNCQRLEELLVLPSSIETLNVSNCKSLELFSPQLVFKPFGDFLFGNCFKLWEYQSTMEQYVQSAASHVDRGRWGRWRSTYDRYRPHVPIPFSIVFPGSEIQDWFSHHSEGHEVNIEVPPNWYSSSFLGFALSVVMAPLCDASNNVLIMYCDLDTHDSDHDLNSNSHRICSFVGAFTSQLGRTPIESDHVWLAYVPSFLSFSCEKWNHIKFSFSSYSDCNVVKSCGVCPMYIKGSSDEEDYSDGSGCSNQDIEGQNPDTSDEGDYSDGGDCSNDDIEGQNPDTSDEGDYSDGSGCSNHDIEGQNPDTSDEGDYSDRGDSSNDDIEEQNPNTSDERDYSDGSGCSNHHREGQNLNTTNERDYSDGSGCINHHREGQNPDSSDEGDYSNRSGCSSDDLLTSTLMSRINPMEWVFITILSFLLLASCYF